MIHVLGILSVILFVVVMILFLEIRTKITRELESSIVSPLTYEEILGQQKGRFRRLMAKKILRDVKKAQNKTAEHCNQPNKS